jgi:PilZ domain
MSEMERRANSRHKSFLQGRVYFNSRRSSVDCLVREISDNGARLKFSTAVVTPDVIELHIPSKDETFRAKLIWRVGDEVGVSFGPEEAGTQSGQGAAPPDLMGRVQTLENEMIALRRMFGELRSEVRRLKGLHD